MAHLPLIALAYDRDSIIASLEAKAPPGEPYTRPLDSLFRAFQAPFAVYARAAHSTKLLEDSLAGLRARLDTLPRTGPAYKELYFRFAALADSLAAARLQRDHAQVLFKRATDPLLPRIERLRAAVRQWEDSTYRGYDSITEGLSRHFGREPQMDTTGPDGKAHLRLGAGRWWIYAHTWVVDDPNQEWYWNVPVAGDSVALDRGSGRRRPRY